MSRRTRIVIGFPAAAVLFGVIRLGEAAERAFDRLGAWANGYPDPWEDAA